MPYRIRWQRCGVGLVLAVLACARPGGDTPAPAAAPEPSDASVVRGENVERAHHQSIEKMLEGKVAGVTVRRTADGGIAVRIRGAASNASEEPLYVVDGMAIQAGPNGALTGINPADIESIRVLKMPAETAMYGSRGANGVIVIKTKRAAPPKP